MMLFEALRQLNIQQGDLVTFYSESSFDENNSDGYFSAITKMSTLYSGVSGEVISFDTGGLKISLGNHGHFSVQIGIDPEDTITYYKRSKMIVIQKGDDSFFVSKDVDFSAQVMRWTNQVTKGTLLGPASYQ